jgi:hypothetical protein
MLQFAIILLTWMKACGFGQNGLDARALSSTKGKIQYRSVFQIPYCFMLDNTHFHHHNHYRDYHPLLTHTATVTNDIFTREDQEFLIKHGALPPERILAIETGGCPHAAIREDVSANMGALETLQAKYGCQLLFVESGGDNLAANYSRELADYIIYVIDVSVSIFGSCCLHF